MQAIETISRPVKKHSQKKESFPVLDYTFAVEGERVLRLVYGSVTDPAIVTTLQFAQSAFNSFRQHLEKFPALKLLEQPLEPQQARFEVLRRFALNNVKQGKTWTKKRTARELLPHLEAEAEALALDMNIDDHRELADWLKQNQKSILVAGVAITREKTRRGFAYSFALLGYERRLLLQCTHLSRTLQSVRMSHNEEDVTKEEMLQ